MSCPFPKEHILGLKKFVEMCKASPGILKFAELAFFKDYIESLGGVIPEGDLPDLGGAPPKAKTTTPPPKSAPEPAPSQEELVESDVELDMDGVVSADEDSPQEMGPTDVTEVSEENIDASNAKKSEAIGYYQSGEFEKAVESYTQAIQLNPRAAMLYAKRGQVYLALKKPNACVRDCSRALELNPDCAAAYKFRGRARRLLGDFLQAAADLRSACKLDFDEQADEWLKEVTPNARKLEEHNRKYERLRSEQQLRQARERVQKARDAQAKAKTEAQNGAGVNDLGGMGGTGGTGGMGGIPPEFLSLFSDPEFLNSMKDPEIAAAFKDIQENPANMMKHQNNPKVAAFIAKMAQKVGGMGGMGGMMGGLGGMMGGLGGMMGGFGGPGGPAPGAAPPPNAARAAPADIDVD